MKSLDVQKLSMYTHIMYAFLSISYSKEYNVWYLDTNDPSADFLIPVESYLGDCMTFSKNLECRTGIVSLVPQLGAGSETKVCPKSTCFNGGGSNETSRECHVQISLPISGGKPKVCGQINHILNKLPHVAPNSYVLFTIGGWYDSNYWTKAVSPNYVHQFITSIISWLNALPFDGVDINWEHPGYEHEGQPMPGRSMVKGNPDFIRNCKDTKCDEEGRVTDTDNLLVFIEQLRKKLYTAGVNSMGLTRHGTPYQISIAVSAIPAVTHAWNISKICRLVDRINLMTYDYTGGWSPRTGHQSALYSAERNCKSESGEFSVECSVDFWIRNGCPREKIIIGVPSYARIFKNVSFGDNPEFPGYHQAHSGLETQTIQGYQKILQDPEFRHYWDENAKASFSYSQTKSEFATYDTQKGVQEKAKWVKANRLGGMMIWKMGEDDPNNHLIRTARNELLTFP
ncbi:hypothetical protein HMI55_002892 [Coelomomyces lativittatus]|nr:hypothetical protein HMI55_002892 [Coelomomyces lativittatus]